MNQSKSEISVASESNAVVFFEWLKNGIVSGEISVNLQSSIVHIVADDGILLLAPAVFKRYLKDHGYDELRHSTLSKKFARLRLHIPNGDLSFHSYWVHTSKRTSKINGWLLPVKTIYGDDNPPAANKRVRKHNGGEADKNMTHIKSIPAVGDSLNHIMKQLDGLSVLEILSLIRNVVAVVAKRVLHF